MRIKCVHGIYSTHCIRILMRTVHIVEFYFYFVQLSYEGGEQETNNLNHKNLNFIKLKPSYKLPKICMQTIKVQNLKIFFSSTLGHKI